MGGDFVIGIIVFLILVTINFLVITKGATRIAEVGARFTLDAIPPSRWRSTPISRPDVDESGRYGLKFPLLADTDHAVAEAWGVWGEKSLYGRKFMGIVRSAFVVDEKGELIGVFYKVSPKDTVPKAEAVLRE